VRLRTLSRLIVIILVIVVGLVIAIHQHMVNGAPKSGNSGTGLIPFESPSVTVPVTFPIQKVQNQRMIWVSLA